MAATQARGSQGPRGSAPSLRNCPRTERKWWPVLFRDEAQAIQSLTAPNPYIFPEKTSRELRQTCGARQLSKSPTIPAYTPTQEYTHTGPEDSASAPGSPTQGRVVGAGAWGWVRRTAVVHGGGRGWAGQVHGAPQHQVAHVAHRVQHLRREQGTLVQTSSHRSVRNV